MENKQYLGDGVYVGHDGYQIWLETSNGISTTNRIALEPQVWAKLVGYVESLRTTVAATANAE